MPPGCVLDNLFGYLFSDGFSFFSPPFKFQLLYISFLEVRVLIRVTELDFIVYVCIACMCILYVFYSIL